MNRVKKFLSLFLVLAMLFALAAPAFALEYTVVKGDNLSKIAKEFLGSATLWREIYNANKDKIKNPNLIFIGQKLTIPVEEPSKVVILHSNDVHGAVEGYAKMAAVKSYYEAQGYEVIVADAGDFSQGETSVSVSQGLTAINLMNMVGYDVVAPGNHEFDYGYQNLKLLERTANFPILAANILYEGTPAFGTNLIIEKAGVKVGFFGLDTPETATKAHPAKIAGVTFKGGEEMYAIAQAQVDELKAAGADVVVCLGHLGIDEETAVNKNRSIDLLEKVNGVDVFIDGHSHSTTEQIAAVTNEAHTVNGAVVVSTGTKFARVGVVKIEDGVISTDYVDVAELEQEDETVAAEAAAIRAEIEAEYGAVFATSAVELNGEKAPGNRTEETNNGDLITDAMLWYATKEDLGVPVANVVAITNGGGIRAAIKAGDVSKKDVNTVLPFGNTVAVDYVTGEVLLEALEASTFCTPTAVGGFPQVAGIEFTVNAYIPYDAGENYPGTTYAAPASINRVTINSINGQPFDPTATYAVVTNDFVAAGGDTYYALSTSEKITDTGTPLDEAVMAYVTEVLGGVIPAEYAEPQGRITIVTEAPDIVILHTNDVHGEYAKNIGYAGLAAYKAEMEKDNYVAVVDAGDFSQGAAIAILSKGEYLVRLVNAVGYDVVVPGNHEFDYGMAQALKNLNDVDATVLSCNFVDLATGKPVYEGYTLKTYGSTTVGFVGISTPETYTKSTPTYFMNDAGEFIYSFCETKLYETVQAAVDAAKAAGADYIVAVGHLGVDESSSPWTSKEVIANTNGIDVFIDGHSHSKIEDTKVANKDGEDVVLAQTGDKLNNIGKVTIKADGTITAELVSGYTEKSETVSAVVAEIEASYKEYTSQVVATSEVDLIAKNPDDSWACRGGETNLGDMIADAYRVVMDVDIGIMNGGGIRANIKAGEVKIDDILAVMTFGNMATAYKLTGQQIIDCLEMGASAYPGLTGGFTHVSGLTYTIDATVESTIVKDEKGSFASVAGERRVKNVMVGDEPIDLEKTYSVACHSYWLTSYGDGMTMFAGAEQISEKHEMYVDNVMLVKYIQEELGGKITAEQYGQPAGRITIVTEAPVEETPAVVAAAEDFVGTWQDSVSQRASLAVVEADEGYAVAVEWSTSATETSLFTMTCTYDAVTGTLTYTDGAQVDTTVDEAGELYNAKEVLGSTTGSFYICEEGHLHWADGEIEAAASCEFEKLLAE